MKKPSTYKLKCNMQKLFKNEDNDIQHLTHLADNRMLFIKEFIEFFHIHGQDSEKLKKFCSEIVKVETLKRKGVIDIEHYSAMLDRNNISLSETEAELCCLVYNGFEPHELRMIYDHGNPESIYVRMHRIKVKISAHTESIMIEEQESPECSEITI